VQLQPFQEKCFKKQFKIFSIAAPSTQQSKKLIFESGATYLKIKIAQNLTKLNLKDES
jgi:hypothetical protein